MTLEELRTYTPYILLALTTVWTVLVFVVNKTFATKKEVSELRSEQQQLRTQHQELSAKVDNLPSHTEVSELRLSIERLNGQIKEIRPQLKSLQRMSDLLIENELKDK